MKTLNKWCAIAPTSSTLQLQACEQNTNHNGDQQTPSSNQQEPKGYGQTETERYLVERYHKATDEVPPEWDNGGIMQDLLCAFQNGVAISNSNGWHKWSDDSEFKAIRKASQQ